MSDRYLGRVSMKPGPAVGRVVARARVGHTTSSSQVDGSGRAVTSAPPPSAEPVDAATSMLQPPDITGAIFVDRSGRRGRRLRRVAYALVLVVLLLLAAFWVLQWLDVFEALP
ncbi:hypothetical protein [Micromonospora sp. NPDC003776]